MRRSGVRAWCVAIGCAALAAASGTVNTASAVDLTTAFSYQGQLLDGGAAANGVYDLQFALHGASTPGVALATNTINDVTVADGLFTVQLNFGNSTNIFGAGQRRWLEIRVRPGASAGAYTPLAPLQEITATPYCIYALASPIPSLDDAYDAGGAGQGRTITANAGAVRLNVSGTGGGLIVDGPHSSSGNSVSIYGITSGDTLIAHNDGTGSAARFLANSASNGNNVVEISSNGNDDSQAISATHNGLGDCGLFTITNENNQGEALEARTNGTGDAVQTVNTGTGRAGLFQIDNAASAGTALYAISNGTGLALRVEGRVGIGTATVPTGVLMAVDGKVLCEELEVQLSQDWPDYVFEAGYPLMPLEQVEEHVRREKHLPGIPSASDVAEKKGIAVGDMQAKLLQKVEELTLYVIDVNKQVKSLESENQELRRRVAALEASVREGGVR